VASIYEPMTDLSGVLPQQKVSVGQKALKELHEGGFSSGEIAQYKERTSKQLLEGGFLPKEIDEHWGEAAPPLAPAERLVESNLGKLPFETRARIAESPWDYVAAGYGQSVMGLMKHGAPKVVMPEHAGLGAKILNMVGGVAGDLPFSILGAVGGGTAGAAVGGAAGSVVPVVGNAAGAVGGAIVGAGAGSAALPQAMREVLLGYYNRGEIKSWSDFVELLGQASLRVGKTTVAGVVAGPAGPLAGKVAGSVGAGPITQALVNDVAVANTFAITAGALDGHIPDKDDFMAGTIVALGMRGAVIAKQRVAPGKTEPAPGPDVAPDAPSPERTGANIFGGVEFTEAARRVEKNLQEVYRETGVPPWEAAAAAERNPALADELRSQTIAGEPVIDKFREIAKQEPEAYETHDLTQRQIDARTGWQNFSRAMSARINERGEIKADPHAVADYLQKFGQEAGFRFVAGPALKSGEYYKGKTEAGPHFGAYTETNLNTGRKKIVSQVYMPDTPDAQWRAWFGLGRSEVLYHEVAHGIDFHVFNRGKGNTNSLSPEMTTELEASSRRFRPKLWEIAPDHNRKPSELMADAIAVWLSNPSERKNMPLFGKAYGAKLEPYQEIVEKTLPTRHTKKTAEGENEEWVSPEGDKIDNGTPVLQAEAGGGGFKPPGPPDDPVKNPPPGPKKIEGDGPKDAETINQKWNEKVHEVKLSDDVYSPTKILRQVVSELTPAEIIDKALADRGLNTREQITFTDMLRSTYGAPERAGMFVQHGTIDAVSLAKTSDHNFMRSFRYAREDGGNFNDYRNYIMALRVIDKTNRGIETGFDVNEAHQLVKEGKAKYARAEKEWTAVNDAVLKYAHDSHLYSAEQVGRMKEANPTHIPFRRLLGDETPYGVYGKGRGFKARKPLKEMEGSDLDLVDPVFMAIDNVHQIVKMADRNRALVYGTEIAQRHGILETDLGLRRLPEVEVKATIAKPRSDKFEAYLPENLRGDYDPFIAERVNRHGMLKENQFAVMRNGKVEFWEASSPELAKLMKGADTQGEAFAVVELATKYANLKRAGIIGSLDFPFRTGFHGELSSWMLDPAHPRPFVPMIRNVFEVFKQGEAFQDFLAKGGAAAALVDMNKNFQVTQMHAIMADTGTFGKMWNVVKHPIEAAFILNERFDIAARMGAQQEFVKQGREPFKAAMMARKAKLDFAEKGTHALVNMWARITPFFRPGVLGGKQIVEGIKNDPVGAATRIGMGIVIPQIILYGLNYLQDEYGDLPENRKYRNRERWEKDMLYVFPEVGGFRLKLPMPQFIGPALGGFTTRALDFMVQKDPKAFEDWITTVMLSFLPPVLPAVGATSFEGVSGVSILTGKKLIPASMEKNSPDMQYTENTTEVAKALSRVLGDRVGMGIPVMSPIEIEQFIRNTAGPNGMLALKALNAPFNANGRPWEVTDIPFVQAFAARTAGANAKPIKDFYSEKGKMDRWIADQRLAIERFAQGAAGSEEELRVATQANRLGMNMDETATAIRMQHSILLGVLNNKEMTTDEKRQRIDQSYSDMIMISRGGLDAIAAFKAATEQAK
jgi:hypothetical protein